MSKWLIKRRYEWHLNKLERLNAVIESNTLYVQSSGRLHSLCRYHAEALQRLTARNAPEPKAKKKV